MNGSEAEALAGWLGSPGLVWVRRSHLAQAVAGRADALLCDQRNSASEAAVGAALLSLWDRALTSGELVDAAVAATALAGWALGMRIVWARRRSGRWT